MDRYISRLSEIAISAGKKIMQIYAEDFEIYTKTDDSPVTKADQLAEQIIIEGLERITPDIPIIAEEMAADGQLPKLISKNARFYLVDPLDGTKEFVKKNGEFTVNIAVISNQKPMVGVIFAPALKQLFVADVEQNFAQMLILNDDFDLQNPISSQDISKPNIANDPYKILASRSHINTKTHDFIKHLQDNNANEVEILNIGSSLKLCYLAVGEADIYPRFGPTMEWDIAAGHAILVASGGHILDDKGQAFSYGKQHLKYLNGNFIAYAH